MQATNAKILRIRKRNPETLRSEFVALLLPMTHTLIVLLLGCSCCSPISWQIIHVSISPFASFLNLTIFVCVFLAFYFVRFDLLRMCYFSRVSSAIPRLKVNGPTSSDNISKNVFFMKDQHKLVGTCWRCF